MVTSFFVKMRGISGRTAVLRLTALLLAVLIFSASAEAAALQRDAAGQQAGRQEKEEKVFTVVATGYTAGVESTGKHPGHPQYGITYSGVKVRRDRVSTIAADPKVFPIGTLLYIPDYGYGVVADTGSAIKGSKIDLYFETVEQVYEEWGKRTVTVKMINLGDGKLSQEHLNKLNQAVEAGLPIPQGDVRF